jgi:hypothetical protein
MDWEARIAAATKQWERWKERAQAALDAAIAAPDIAPQFPEYRAGELKNLRRQVEYFAAKVEEGKRGYLFMSKSDQNSPEWQKANEKLIAEACKAECVRYESEDTSSIPS